MGWITHHDKLLLWGGSGIYEKANGLKNYNFLNDEYAFDIASEMWELIKPSDDSQLAPLNNATPSPRYTPVLQLVGDCLFLFSGYTEDRFGKRKLNDTWVRSGQHWLPIAAGKQQGYRMGDDHPGLRYGSMSASDKAFVYVCGGFSDEGDHNDLWAFDMFEFRWRLLAPDLLSERVPQARYCAAFAYHSNRLFLFGGRSRLFPKLQFNDMWMYDLNSFQWTLISGNRSPQRYDNMAEYPAYHAKASSVVVGNYWYVWGGEGKNGHVSDFWRFNFQTFEWQLIQAARPDDPLLW